MTAAALVTLVTCLTPVLGTLLACLFDPAHLAHPKK